MLMTNEQELKIYGRPKFMERRKKAFNFIQDKIVRNESVYKSWKDTTMILNEYIVYFPLSGTPLFHVIIDGLRFEITKGARNGSPHGIRRID